MSKQVLKNEIGIEYTGYFLFYSCLPKKQSEWEYTEYLWFCNIWCNISCIVNNGGGGDKSTFWFSFIKQTYSMLDEFNFTAMCSILIFICYCKNINKVYLTASCELLCRILFNFKSPIAMIESSIWVNCSTIFWVILLNNNEAIFFTFKLINQINVLYRDFIPFFGWHPELKY